MTDRTGKLIKLEDAALRRTLEVQEFPWADFGPLDFVVADNSRKNVLIKQFHDPGELQEKVRVPEEFRRQLGPKSQPVFPEDLTEAYRQSQRELDLRRRRRMLDEDEIIAMELAEIVARKEQAKTRDAAVAKKQAQDAAAAAAGESDPAAALDDQAGTSLPANDVLQDARSAGAAALRGAGDAPGEEPPPTMTRVGSAVTQDESARAADLSEELREEAFATGHARGLEAGRAEGFAAGREDGHAVGRSAGFDEGFREGEEKGMAASMSRQARYFELIAGTARELDGLRTEILGAGKDIFIELVKICAEKVLRRQASLDARALSDLFQSVIGQFAENHPVTVEIHPDDAVRFQKAVRASEGGRGEGTRSLKVVGNPALEPGDMKVDAGTEVVFVDLRKSVDALVDKLAPELFEEVSANEGSAEEEAYEDPEANLPRVG